jgi:hypothetical protein
MDIEAIEKDAVVLTRYQIYLTQAHDGILLTLYGDDSAGNAREIATVVMHPNGAEEIANQLLHAQLRLKRADEAHEQPRIDRPWQGGKMVKQRDVLL